MRGRDQDRDRERRRFSAQRTYWSTTQATATVQAGPCPKPVPNLGPRQGSQGLKLIPGLDHWDSSSSLVRVTGTQARPWPRSLGLKLVPNQGHRDSSSCMTSVCLQVHCIDVGSEEPWASRQHSLWDVSVANTSLSHCTLLSAHRRVFLTTCLCV